MSYLTEKTIGEILDNNFFIPSYQRGYRWTERQIEDLLEDINAFTPKAIDSSGNKTWYCLQPVVVKLCDEKTKNENKLIGNWYEVIDGQQRLTSIFLIIHYFNEIFNSEQKLNEINLKYETRERKNQDTDKGSFEFLKGLTIDEKLNGDKICYDNIDYFHISSAYYKIHDWVKNFKSKFNKDLDSSLFISKFIDNSKVIWYEIDEGKDSIEIFTRINMGKIPLTNAELIKALFLNSSNFDNSELEKIRLRQMEIASEWDRIEYSLQNEELWYFINNSENELPTRIEYLLNIVKNIEGVQNESDQYSIFRFFSKKFKSNTKYEIDANWKEIKNIFQTIDEWFTDRELYHKIGYLITTGDGITDLLREAHGKQKKVFRKLITEKIANKVKCANLLELEYGANNKTITDILLFHNIQLVLANENDMLRFPFNKFKSKKDGWSLEHIHAQNSKEINELEDFYAWYNTLDSELKQDVPMELLDKISKLEDAQKFKDVDISKLVNEISENFGELEIHTIDNLALLSKNDNSSLNNSIFPLKRKKIIELEKNGSFIPIATRNVFQKYYKGCSKQLSKWNKEDREAYLKDIANVVSNLI